MFFKKDLIERVNCMEARLDDMRYELNLASKKIYELERARLKKEIKETTGYKPKRGAGRPKKVEEPVKRKPGRPRKDGK
jgi:hypothetical protein